MNTRNIAMPAIENSISPLSKGIGWIEQAGTSAALAQQKWNLLREEISLPAAVLSASKLAHNLEWMHSFMQRYGVAFAPHGKTSMAPQLFRMQLQAGAWGITVATAQQARAAHAHGVRRVLMANELAGRGNFEIVRALQQDAGFEFYCLVDSADLVHQLHSYFASHGQKLRVLIELGVEGGRAGVRTQTQLDDVVAAIAAASDTIELCGIEIYEGVLKDEESIRAFLQRAVVTTRELLERSAFRTAPALLSGAGSAWYDVVAAEFTSANLGDAVQIVLRPGCYLTHDIGHYAEAQQRITRCNPVARELGTDLQTALQIWAVVQSRPEAGRAIVSMGRRDAAFDSGLPVPALHYRPGTATPTEAPAHWTVSKLMDQHAYLDLAADDDLKVGDMLSFDIAHPCLTFDKWRTLLLVDDEYNVLDVIETFF